jgi:hypothetical protein
LLRRRARKRTGQRLRARPKAQAECSSSAHRTGATPRPSCPDQVRWIERLHNGTVSSSASSTSTDHVAAVAGGSDRGLLGLAMARHWWVVATDQRLLVFRLFEEQPTLPDSGMALERSAHSRAAPSTRRRSASSAHGYMCESAESATCSGFLVVLPADRPSSPVSQLAPERSGSATARVRARPGRRRRGRLPRGSPAACAAAGPRSAAGQCAGQGCGGPRPGAAATS